MATEPLRPALGGAHCQYGRGQWPAPAPLLEDRIHGHAAPQAPRYELKVTFSTYKEDLGIKDDDVATRARMSITARYTLTSLENPDEKPFSGKTRSFVSYNILSDPYSTTAAEEDALARLCSGGR